ncbi:MAG: T9SS type A sorting domain-containing protein [Bacteroidetes bacterium]|nr:T9SS type A sorting domain-containing protein [Bacteroidota bacterium]
MAESAKSLLATSDGGFLLLGDIGSTEGGDVVCNSLAHTVALKVDSTGNIQWQTCLSGDPNGSGPGLSRAVEAADGGYLAVGGTYASTGIWHENHGQSDYFAVKLNASGAVEWLHCYGGSGWDSAVPVKATPDGGFVIAGVAQVPDGQVTTGDHGEIWVIKIDTLGNLVWNRRMGGSVEPGLGQSVRELVVNLNGTILVVGSAGTNDGDISGNHGSNDVWLVLLDSSGAILQQHCYGGSGDDYAWGGAASASGGYVIAGHALSDDGDVSGIHGMEHPDAWVFKVDTALNLIWQKCIGGTESDMAYAMALTPAGEAIISGSTGSNDGDVSGYHGNGDIWVAKLGSDINAITDDAFSGGPILAYPSPAINEVNVNLSDPLPLPATLEVVDALGCIVKHRSVAAGVKSLLIPVYGWANGLYGIRLTMGIQLRTARFVKQ